MPSNTGTVYDSGNHSVDDFFRQIKLEIEAMSAVGTHGNCVGFFGHTAHFPGSGEGKPAFRMELLLELMPNGELFTHLHEKKMFQTWPEKIRILRGIATGVQYLHSKDIVHRDLSSVNILFCENWTPKIGDFGCARVIKGGTYDPKKVLGSPAYMSPEQLVGSPLRTNSDVWALGVLIWEVISERGPWNDRNSNDRAILKQHIVDNSGKLPQIPSTRFEVMYAKHYESQVADLLAGCVCVRESVYLWVCARWSRLLGPSCKLTDKHTYTHTRIFVRHRVLPSNADKANQCRRCSQVEIRMKAEYFNFLRMLGTTCRTD